jgi:glycosyltransferase involved in cell wall biosynthesis
MPPLPGLSVVIPVYNEPRWIGPTVDAVAAALERADFPTAEIVVVDDGSDAETRSVLSGLTSHVPLRVMRQDNLGRFAARRTGIEDARHPLVLLLDSRIRLHPDSLRFVAERLRDEPNRTAWNGHVEIEVHRNPFARFWRVLNRATFPAYLADPRTVTFGLDDYDAFPKGTGCFLAPRQQLLDAIGEFRSLYGDALRHSSDDTVLIKSIAARQRVTISPGFACTYNARTTLRAFVDHVFHRGTTFVDGFARPGTRFFPLLAAFFPAAIAFLVVSARRPRVGAAAVGSIPGVAAATAVRMRAPWRDVGAFATLSLPFAAAYSAGIVRGAALLVRARLSGRPQNDGGTR